MALEINGLDVRISTVAGHGPHGLDGIGEGGFPVRFSLRIIVTAVMHDFNALYTIERG